MSCFQEASRLRRLAANRSVFFRYTRHAREEMTKDSIVRIDVENMLRRCSVTLIEQSGGEETWRAEGTDNDGRAITAVVVVYEVQIEIKIITAWAK
jgi:hypothetical protein